MTGRPSAGLGQNGQAQVKKCYICITICFGFNIFVVFGIVEVSLQYVSSCTRVRDQVGIFHSRLPGLKYEAFWKCSKCSTFACVHAEMSPTGVIAALAVAVGVLAVALLLTIGVAIHRRRAHYSREV